MKHQITVRAIAESAGVSAMTVSRALRRESNVDPETAARIIEVADRLGYQRNPLVSTVMSTMRGTKQPLCNPVIAFLTVDTAGLHPEHRLSSQLYLEGAQARASESGFKVEEFVIQPSRQGSKTISKMLYARNIRGILVGPLCRSCGHLSLDWNEFSSSAISINLVKPDLNRCSVDPVQSLNLAIRQLKRLGYRRIGFGIPPMEVSLSRHRSRAMYLDYQCQLPPEQTVGFIKDWSLSGLENWLRKENPDALISHGDDVLAWLNALGIRMPLDIGYVDINLTEGTHVPLAGVSFNYQNIGATAVSMVINELLRNNLGLPRDPVHSYIQGRWQDGPTVALQQQYSNGSKTRKIEDNQEKTEDTRPKQFYPIAKAATPIQWKSLNLRNAATHSYRQKKNISNWDEGLGLPLLPGEHNIHAVPFHLIDERTNKGKSYVLFKDEDALTIPVGKACESVYFLIAAGFISSHGSVATITYKWADGESESRPLVAYFNSPPDPTINDSWITESGVQDWWPTFPHFCGESSKAFRVGKDSQNTVEWRYLYTLQWMNSRPNFALNSITIQTLPKKGARLALLATTLLLPA